MPGLCCSQLVCLDQRRQITQLMVLLRSYHGAGCIAMGWAQLVKEPEVGREIMFGALNPCVWLVGCSCTRAAQLKKIPMMVLGALLLFVLGCILLIFVSLLSVLTADGSHSGMGQSDVIFGGL